MASSENSESEDEVPQRQVQCRIRSWTGSMPLRASGISTRSGGCCICVVTMMNLLLGQEVITLWQDVDR